MSDTKYPASRHLTQRKNLMIFRFLVPRAFIRVYNMSDFKATIFIRRYYVKMRARPAILVLSLWGSHVGSVNPNVFA